MSEIPLRAEGGSAWPRARFNEPQVCASTLSLRQAFRIQAALSAANGQKQQSRDFWIYLGQTKVGGGDEGNASSLP